MKKIIIIFLLSLISNFLVSQNITLQELTNLGLRNNWKEIDTYLSSRGWEYFNSKEYSDDITLSEINWSYKKDRYSDKATGWVTAIVNGDVPCRVSYGVFNKTSYDIMANGLTSLGFQSEDNKIKDDYIYSRYKNSNYYLTIETSKKNDDDNNFLSVTSWYFYLTRKGSKLDGNNGKKKEYYENGNLKREYTLIDGDYSGEFKEYYENGILNSIGMLYNGKKEGKFIINTEEGKLFGELTYKNNKQSGEFKIYHENGKIKKIGTYEDGKEQGKIIEYFDNGVKEKEYTIKNGKSTGIYFTYDEIGRIKIECNYKENIIECKTFEYNENDKKPKNKQIGSFDRDVKKQGKWYDFELKDDKIIDTLSSINFIDGKKSGLCKYYEGDSLVIAEYENDLLNGDFTSYKKKVVFNIDGKGVLSPYYTKASEGKYRNNLRYGKWINYATGFQVPIGTVSLEEEHILKMFVKIAEGTYENDKKTGKWLYYRNDNNTLEDEVEYLEGVRHGLTKVYYQRIKIPLKIGDLVKQKTIYQPVTVIINFKNGKRNGEYMFLDSAKTLLHSGTFVNDLKHGKWIESELVKKDSLDVGDNYYEEGVYENGERNNEWKYYKNKDKNLITFNYKNGKLQGKTTSWNDNNKPKFISYFNDDKFVGVEVFNSEGSAITKKYEIEDFSNSMKCNYTYFSELGSFSQYYWVKRDKPLIARDFITDFETKLSSNNSENIRTAGKAIGYLPDGKLLYSGDLINNLKEGEWIFIDYPQNVKLKINYVNNITQKEEYTFNDKDTPFSGKYIYLNKEDNIKEERKIKNGLREGKTYYIDQKGKTIKKESYKLGILQK